MKKTVYFSDFEEEFKAYGREENFSHEGLMALFESLEQYEQELNEDLELDVIALCCNYTEYESIQEFNENYGKECEFIEDIEHYTYVIKINDDSFIIQDF